MTRPRTIDELGRLVLHPDAQGHRLDVYACFVAHPLLEAKTPQSVEEIAEALKKGLGLSVPGLAISTTLRNLEREGLVGAKDGRWTLTPRGRTDFRTKTLHSSQVHSEMVQVVTDAVEEEMRKKTDTQQQVLIKAVFETALAKILEALSSIGTAYLKGASYTEHYQAFKPIVETSIKDVGSLNVENQIGVEAALLPAIEACFRKPNVKFERGLLQAATKHVMLRILGVDPELQRYRAEMFKGASLLVDTNIVISATCKGSERYDHTRYLLSACRNLGVQLLISDVTIAEYVNAVDSIDRVYRNAAGRRLDARLIENEIARTFYDSKPKHRDWDAFIAQTRAGAQIFAEEWGVQIVEHAKHSVASKDVERLSTLLINENAYGSKNPQLVKHDAICILLVQALRKEKPQAAFESPWFVSHHRALRAREDRMREQMGFVLSSTISTDALFDLLYPFLWTDADQANASAAFRSMLSAALFAFAIPSAESFVNYIATETDVPSENKQLLVRIIEESHKRRVLYSQVESGRVGSGLITFEEIMKEAIESRRGSEKSNQVLSRLVQKIQTLQQRSPNTLAASVDTRSMGQLLERVENAKGSVEKGRSLEALGAAIVESIDGFVIVDRNVRTEAEEIDIMVQNAAGINWGDPILVECKNWSKPVGKNDVVSFIDKLAVQRASTGILVAVNGITGSEHTDARLKVREALWGKGIRIIVLTSSDLRTLVVRGNLAEMLTEKYYKVESF